MLALIDPRQKVRKAEYERVFPELEQQLAAGQRAARLAGMPIVLLFEGWDAAGKGMLINRLAQVLDPRGFRVHLTLDPTPEENRYPWMWRFWRILPAAGEILILDHSWYHRIWKEHAEGGLSPWEFQRAMEDILEFERQLADAGILIIKFWLHIDAREQRKRLKRLESSPATRWKVTREQWTQNKNYRKWLAVADRVLEASSTSENPWHIVESHQGRFARLKVFRTLVATITGALRERQSAPGEPPRPMVEPEEGEFYRPTILDRLDLTKSLGRDEYKKRLKRLQRTLYELEHECYRAGVPVIIVFEGWDAAGKGGVIKRLTRGLDPRGYEVVPVGPPTAEEKAHHYLWRFWRRLPKTGHITIFDRSWYGRVLVERVEGFCREQEWRRAYREINEFEKQLTDFGTVLLKFWLHIDQEEQLRRFQARQADPTKQWKITEEDWRNRSKWRQYELAVVQMLEKTSTTYAPWTILEANCKLFARIKALETVVARLEEALR